MLIGPSSDIIGPGKYVSLTYSIADEAGNVVEQNDLPVEFRHVVAEVRMQNEAGDV